MIAFAYILGYLVTFWYFYDDHLAVWSGWNCGDINYIFWVFAVIIVWSSIDKAEERR